MSDITSYEIDFLPVGNGDRSGDAITVRWKDGNNFKVLVYDGGTQQSGQELVDHIKKHYGTDTIDYLVNSHPDADHASGLSIVLDQLNVKEVWIHRPWEYSAIIRDYFHDGRITDASLAERLKSKMAAAYAIEELALEKNISIHEPFQGCQIGPFTVLSPEKDWYIHDLIPAFAKSPEQKTVVAEATGRILISFAEGLRKVADWIAEKWDGESLREDVETSAENESSVILFSIFGTRGILLTGDAGVETLDRAATYATALGHDLPNLLRFVQIPHHGSRNNVSTSILDRIIGARKPIDDGEYTKTAYISAAKGSTTHPRKMVVNAFLRRGTRVVATQGQSKCFYVDMPPRDGWVSATPLTFSTEVESWN